MQRAHLPDPGAYITVHLRNGKSFTGCVSEGHVWAAEEGGLICLAIGPKGRGPDMQNAENLWQYIDLADVCAYEWDCRP